MKLLKKGGLKEESDDEELALDGFGMGASKQEEEEEGRRSRSAGSQRVVEPEDSAEAIADFYEESSHNKLTLLSRPYSCHVQY